MAEPIVNIIEAVLSLDSGAIVSFSSEPTDETEYLAMIDWDSENANPSHPTWAAVVAERTTMQSASDDMQYSRDRAKAYASLQEQNDMQYWDGVNTTTTWEDHIAAVKAAHPKP